MNPFQITKKQFNSDMCLVCGKSNPFGLHTHFYELNDHRLVGILKGDDIHQSYPKRMHGGIITALLDETIGRTIQTTDIETWGVTVEITVQFLKPVPLCEKLLVVGMVTRDRSRMLEGEGYICDTNGLILATAQAKYLKVNIDQIVDKTHFLSNAWFMIDDQVDMKEVYLPK